MAQPLPQIPGVRLSAVPAKIKNWQRDDLLLIEIAEGASVSATFTQNAFCAAPVLVAKDHIRQGNIRALLINAGNANAATGERGVRTAEQSCEGVAKALGISARQVLPFSTGVIGEHLPVEKILDALPAAVEKLQADAWDSAAKAIMTTDTRPKTASRTVEVAGVTITIAGIAKGAGMIQPNMATMLAYVATDARIGQPLLDELVKEAVGASFNRISVDGDTSTNDACVLIASGTTGEEIGPDSDAYAQLKAAIVDVHIELAQAIVRDGEGATKFVTVQVNNAASSKEALRMAFEIGESPLVKTAMYASDPNWGRLVMAIGNAGAENLDTSKISVFLDDVQIVDAGGRADSYTEEAGQKIFEQPEFTITVDLQRGDACEHIWTCDFSHEYVTINAEYRT
ncbi:bifunctional glutamate N-acetyltransferase/amino-acid acetyltransferase ArgJ [Microbulbifer elongatus]|uniref:bifunctional glutamate N-acetyltransferase/amino-acid acetyltransferase ArgJ n=1 Tax=Microbulbifer elongatus TaxID=86173 RepID=UPI001CFD103E|nr:bifunctional glutamate N-acetyltransferase/amino-acid acetyltransferase ArgJ [Microbulbifer elongatus]